MLLLLCAGCAAASAPRNPSRAPEAPAERCMSAALPSVSAASLQRLGGASNVLEYQNLWKSEHAGTSAGSLEGTRASEVRARIHAKLPEIQACYEAALSRAADGAGRVVVRFVIEASGRVAAANIAADSFGSPEVSCCVVRRVAHWSFAPVSGDFVVVEYPFAVRMAHGR